MVREPEEINVEDLVFSDGAIEKLQGHGVALIDVFNVLYNAPQFFRDLPDRGGTHVMLGPDAIGRFFYIVLAPTPIEGTWFIVTGYHYDRTRALKYYRVE